MKVLQINTVYGEGSTGKIAKDIHDICVEQGIGCVTAYRCRWKNRQTWPDTVEISTMLDSRIHGVLARSTMLKGCFSYGRTAHFLKWVEAYGPDVIHLHNLHGSYVNIPMLMRYVKQKNIPVVWTLHDCWPFTGLCAYFSAVRCDRWQSGCGSCPLKKELSSGLVDRTHFVWEQKKKWFTGIRHGVIVTPSNWLAGLVKQSFLGDYRVQTIHNGIDLNVFHPTPSDFKKQNGIEKKKMVLGVAFDWGYRKGLDVVVQLAKELPAEYAVVLVGTDEKVDAELPENVVSIHRTNNQRELAEIYTAADVLINPTREDNFPTVNLEALACGTPVITFKTGGSPEMLDKSSGIVVDQEDVEGMKAAILHSCSQAAFSPLDCVRRGKEYDKNRKLGEYVGLYQNLLKEKMRSDGTK